MREDETGRAEAFVKNDKRAAVSGLLLETMSAVLETPLELIGELSFVGCPKTIFLPACIRR